MIMLVLGRVVIFRAVTGGFENICCVCFEKNKKNKKNKKIKNNKCDFLFFMFCRLVIGSSTILRQVDPSFSDISLVQVLCK